MKLSGTNVPGPDLPEQAGNIVIIKKHYQGNLKWLATLFVE